MCVRACACVCMCVWWEGGVGWMALPREMSSHELKNCSVLEMLTFASCSVTSKFNTISP
jgi:hypothetical protein